MFTNALQLLLCLFALPFVASSPVFLSTPIVLLDEATFLGKSDEARATHAFLGIKFAEAPRLRLPTPVGPYTGVHNSTSFGPSCPQQNLLHVPSVVDDSSTSIDILGLKGPPQRKDPPSEDCLNLNVWIPAGTSASARLPVVVWIHGGAFIMGSAQSYDGGVIVQRSIDLGEPVIYVSMNYRLSAFGFLGGQEVKNARVGNLGLEDQRLALQWVQKYIGQFGGNPSRVTIWGQSAGAISASLHMLTNNGNPEGLFHGAFMQSGAPIPIGDVTQGQDAYDALTAETGCDAAQSSLDCLRDLPYIKLKAAVDKAPGVLSYQSLRLAFLPQVDGRFLVDTPQNLVLNHTVARIPYVTGSCDDEGTLFSLFTSFVVWDDKKFRDYILNNYIVGATEGDVGDLFDTQYPDDPSVGSPFDTGTKYAFMQYKRLAAIQGDLIFQAPRRFFLEQTYDKQPTWSFLSKRNKSVSFMNRQWGFLGAAHGTDISNVYGPGDMTDYLIHFVNHGDPNGPGDGLIEWPQYDVQSRHQLTFLDNSSSPLVVTADIHRQDAFQKLTELSLKFSG